MVHTSFCPVMARVVRRQERMRLLCGQIRLFRNVSFCCCNGGCTLVELPTEGRFLCSALLVSDTRYVIFQLSCGCKGALILCRHLRHNRLVYCCLRGSVAGAVCSSRSSPWAYVCR